MTDRERFVRTLTGQEVDRVPFMKIFGVTNAIVPAWEKEYPGISKCIDKLLKFEGSYRGWDIMPVNTGLANVGPSQVVEDTPSHVIRRHATGAVILSKKGGDYHTQTLEWPVKGPEDWDRIKSLHLNPDDPNRFPKNWADLAPRYQARTYPMQLTHGGVYGFARNLMGDENLAYAFYDQPDLVHDIMDSYTEMAIAIWTKMAAGVDFDLVECWEDMCYRGGSLVSPKTFREFMKPNYQKIRTFCDAHNIPIILVDSDGYIEDLTELMAESGVNTMYPYEVQSGNDVFRIRDKFPEFGIIGGLNKEVMAWGKDAIDREMEKARRLIRLGRLIPGPDHFVLSNVTFESYRYFMGSLREVVMTTRPGA